MTKSRLSLLIVAMVIAAIIMAGCTTPNQTSQGPGQTVSTNASTSSTTISTSTATSSSVASASPTVSPTPSASPTAATPTPAPSASGKISTSIQFDQDPGTVSRGTNVSLGIEVTAPTSSQLMVCGHGAVTVSMGTVTQGDASGCFRTAYYRLDTSGLSPGTYTVTLSYAGDSTYQSSQSTSKITVTA